MAWNMVLTYLHFRILQFGLRASGGQHSQGHTGRGAWARKVRKIVGWEVSYVNMGWTWDEHGMNMGIQHQKWLGFQQVRWDMSQSQEWRQMRVSPWKNWIEGIKLRRYRYFARKFTEVTCRIICDGGNQQKYRGICHRPQERERSIDMRSNRKESEVVWE